VRDLGPLRPHTESKPSAMNLFIDIAKSQQSRPQRHDADACAPMNVGGRDEALPRTPH